MFNQEWLFILVGLTCNCTVILLAKNIFQELGPKFRVFKDDPPLTFMQKKKR